VGVARAEPDCSHCSYGSEGDVTYAWPCRCRSTNSSLCLTQLLGVAREKPYYMHCGHGSKGDVADAREQTAARTAHVALLQLRIPAAFFQDAGGAGAATYGSSAAAAAGGAAAAAAGPARQNGWGHAEAAVGPAAAGAAAAAGPLAHEDVLAALHPPDEPPLDEYGAEALDMFQYLYEAGALSTPKAEGAGRRDLWDPLQIFTSFYPRDIPQAEQ